MQFELNNVKRLNIMLKNNFELITATPIIIRIPEKIMKDMEFQKNLGIKGIFIGVLNIALKLLLSNWKKI
jgi:hypothetical protein